MVSEQRWFPQGKARRYDDTDLSNQIEWIGGYNRKVEEGAGKIKINLRVE